MPGYDRKYQGAADAMKALGARAFPSRETEINPEMHKQKRMDMLLNYSLHDVMRMAREGDPQAKGVMSELSSTSDLGYNEPQGNNNSRYRDPGRESLVSDMMYRSRTDEPDDFAELLRMRAMQRKNRMDTNSGRSSSMMDRVSSSVMGEFGY